MTITSRRILRGRILSFLRRPAGVGDASSYRHLADGVVVVEDGRIVAVADAGEIDAFRTAGCVVDDHRGKLILPGFVDTHIHFPQTRVIASYGEQLLEWLSKYTFPAEMRYADRGHAEAGARFFLDELARNGTTTAVVYGSVHREAIEAFFEESERRGTLMLAGKTMMDRGAPAPLTDTAESGYRDTTALVKAWHRRGRQRVVVTPRFAITSTPAQLEAAGALARENPDCLVQTHMSENRAEIAYTAELYPERAGYLDVYDHYGLVGPRTLLGHCIHLRPDEIERMSEAGAVAVFCPTSNLFIGSGLFDHDGLEKGPHPVRIGLATDVGGGTDYSMLRTAAEAYKIMQLRGQKLSALSAFDRMTRANAEVIGEADEIGRIEPGLAADLVVLDSRATPAMAHRMEAVDGDLEEELFVLMTLGDDRAVAATYVAGRPVGAR
ncbi:guanine deaminase [Oharaeibacter diazotrophicus]|uniref:Guanine deaminase n=1 Tax=Oharaeibacter diazotrophicus TaxID=1920512 RepID=A0A4R6RB82_9HYPH|nr:guanine deaminase [Oharaeibacter diazotrophicus]TDP83299.1 guanine deaminase [Oharaeibacter diazotrophicus]BBE72133.1 guanine deaminase [Pleomorphomonas sp. SM30]GLS78899.1 guanine deaminase [Oharaeibacter diazotrophicus]